MNFTNLKLIWRNLLKNSGITATNIFGLSVGLAVSTLIMLFLQFEYSFDKANPAQKDFYRLITTFKYPNSPESSTALSSPMMGPYLQRESSDIEDYLRVLSDNENFVCRANGRETFIQKSLQVDSSFFSFFNYPLLHGDAGSAFDKLENILITRTVSEELFGAENPVGLTLEYTYALDAWKDTTIHYTVSAVFDHLPPNSHLQFEALTPFDNRRFNNRNSNSLWHGVMANTYYRFRSSANDPRLVASTFQSHLKKEMPNYEMVGLSLQAFADIHLDSGMLQYDGNNFQKTNRKYLQVLGLIALFILIISCINFANLSTVLAMRRVREVGVRKSLGANRINILMQFLGEAILMSVAGGIAALIWIKFLEKPFLAILGKNIDLSFGITMVVTYTIAIISLGILAGLFPAMQAARYSAVEAFQRLGTSLSVKRPFIQRLVVLQFMLSGMLIIGAVICYKQLWFLQHKKLGFQFEQVIELNLGNGNWTRARAIKKELAAIPGIIDISGSDISIGTIDGQNGVGVRNEETQKWETYPMSINRADYNYFDLYEMQFVSGQAPTIEGAANEKEFVVNESFVKRVGWKDDPIGKEILRNGMEESGPGRVVGVIKDIHHNTLHHQISPVCFQASSFSPILSLKVDPQNLKSVLPQIGRVWNKHIKDRPFDYKFMDAHFASLYLTESRLGQLLLIATILSIIIACLGLLALSTFIIQQRKKEIGIRKVLGATTTSIVSLLSKDFLKLVLIAFIIASPIAWYIMNEWLRGFAYRIDIEWWIFALAGIAALVVAFITVSFQSMKAALAHPADSLKTE